MSRQSNQWRNKESVQNEFKEELIDLARVTRVVKWWRRMRFRATVVAWNWKWKVWLWVWKANEVATAIKKAISSAKKELKFLPIINWTIDRDVLVKFKWAQVLLMPACEGTWIIAWWSIRKIAEVAWVNNLLSKRFWSTNKLVNAQAMMKAITVLWNTNEHIKNSKKEKNIDKEEGDWVKNAKSKLLENVPTDDDAS